MIDIKFGKSGEIVMSLYSAFASQLKEMNAELLIMKKNIYSWQYDNTLDSQSTMSMSKSNMKTSQRNVATEKLEYDWTLCLSLTLLIVNWLK